MRALERQACKNGCQEVELSVSLPSKDFYDRLGYRIMEEYCLAVGEGERLHFWKAKKPIPPEDR
jgi:hypothetical protein